MFFIQHISIIIVRNILFICKRKRWTKIPQRGRTEAPAPPSARGPALVAVAPASVVKASPPASVVKAAAPASVV